MKREELVEYSVVCIDDIPSDVRDEAINGCTSFFAFDSMDAEEVMGAYKQRIKDLEAENERLKAHVPVWHYVADGDLPKTLNVDREREVYALIESKESGTTDKWTQSLLYKENHDWFEDNVWFYDLDTPLREGLKVVMWCELPQPPTTEDSSETEK